MSRLAVATLALVCLSTGASALNAQDPAPLGVVGEVDYARYAGEWREIARLPNRFQRNCASDVVATYTPRPDGRIGVLNRCTEADGTISEAEGVARRVDGQPPSVLQVRFAPGILSWLPSVWGDYQIVDLGDDYDYALIGTPDRKYLWILSRTPTLAPAVYDRLLARAAAQGFDTSKLVKTPARSSER